MPKQKMDAEPVLEKVWRYAKSQNRGVTHYNTWGYATASYWIKRYNAAYPEHRIDVFAGHPQ